MMRILFSLFYISSMRKTSEEFNSGTMISNIWTLCSAHGELDGKRLRRTHNKGTEKEWTENYYYVLEARLVLHPKILISIQTEFVDNEGGKETEKQDCERKACWRLMEKLKKAFPRLPICLCADSLYACEGFFERCRGKSWRYKEGSVPSVGEEYRKLKRMEKNRREHALETGKGWHDYVTDVDDNGYKVNLVEYGEGREQACKKGKKKGEARTIRKEFWFLTDLPVTKKNVEGVAGRERMRWKIENEGFNAQKKHGYCLEHPFSKNYQALKCHYYLIQIGHMIGQFMDAWERIWKKAKQSLEQKHRRMLESMKETPLKEYKEKIKKKIQIRFI